MDKYRVVIEPQAVEDLREMTAYITHTLMEPETSSRIFNTVKTRIFSLEEMPYRQKTVNDDALAALGIRRLPAGNYSVFYYVSEGERAVHVVRVLPDRRQWQNLL